MSGSFEKNLTGILSRNERKTEERHADFTGTVTVDNVDYFLDAYVRERKDGSGKFFSLKLKPKNKQGAGSSGGGGGQRSGSGGSRGGWDPGDSDVPF